MAQPPPKPRNRSWDENYAELLTFKAMHGHCDVPLNHKTDRVLGKWVAHLRENCNQNNLSPERRAALNAIGFNWNPHEQKWIEMFERLKAFKASEGHCKVPTNWKADRKLGKWVMRQREKRKNGILPDSRLEKLESIGFVWKVHKVEQNKETRKTQHVDEKWQGRYESLVKFQEEHSHCNVPKVYDRDPALGKWVQEQRVMNQRNLLKADRKKLLEDIGFVFSYRAQKIQQDWNQMYELLKACSETSNEGQFKVTVADSSLSRWIQRQKEAYKNYRLDPGREVLLNKINFAFPERPPKVEDTPPTGTTMPTHAFGANTTGDNLFADSIGMGVGGSMAQQALLLGRPDSVAAHLGSLRAANPGLAAGVVPVDNSNGGSEADKLIGMKIAQGVDVLAKCMGISSTELTERLALSSKSALDPPVASAKPAAKLKSPQGKRKKLQSPKKALPQPTREEDKTSTETTDEEEPQPKPLLNAFTQLLPKIVALRDNVVSEELESCQRDCVKYLESFVRKEKGWDPRPSEGDSYSRLLALATELGVLLDHRLERSQSIIHTCEMYFDHIYQRAKKKKTDNSKGGSGESAVDGSTSDGSDGNDSATNPDNNIKADPETVGMTKPGSKNNTTDAGPEEDTKTRMDPPSDEPVAKRSRVDAHGNSNYMI